MFTRFRMNVQQYPRLFIVWLVGCGLAVAESLIPRLVGIDARHVEYATAVDFILALVFAQLVYHWVVSNSGRTAILLDILSRFEGREVCTVEGHYVSEDEFDEEYDEEPEPDDEPEPEEEEPIL